MKTASETGTRRFLERYGIDALSGMARGLFASLITGLILRQLALLLLKVPALEIPGNFLQLAGNFAVQMTGPAIALAVAHSLKAPPLVLYAVPAVGFLSYAPVILARAGAQGVLTAVLSGGAPGGPVGAFLAAVIATELGSRVNGRTRLDILLVPATVILSGGIVGLLAGPPVNALMLFLGRVIMKATELQPIPMGILVSVIMGLLLTLPVSSAAVSIILGWSGLAAGAATVGCSCQMIGFAVASFRENRVGGLLSQGLGTSMLQIPNIVRNPRIWIPPTLASAILGPLSTAVFRMENNAAGGGMGTSGLVGQINTLMVMGGGAPVWIRILLLHFLLPAALSLLFSELLRKRGWIRPGDMKLP